MKNKINKGTFVCRNMGVLFSKGKYVILQDPDDILAKNIINLCYNYAEKYSYQLIRFHIFSGKEKRNKYYIKNKIENRCIYQPELSTYIFYGNNNELGKIDIYINNKFIKREVYIKALNILKKYYLKMYIICYEDQLLIFFLYKTANSFYYLNKFGYYYLPNSISITRNNGNINNLKFIFIFIYLRIVFEYSKNNKYEIDIINLLLKSLIKGVKIDKTLYSFSKDNKFFKYIINIYLNNFFINEENKYILKQLKKKLNIYITK